MSATSTFALPAGACDCDVHFYGASREYAPRADAGLAPQQGSAGDSRARWPR